MKEKRKYALMNEKHMLIHKQLITEQCFERQKKFIHIDALGKLSGVKNFSLEGKN